MKSIDEMTTELNLIKNLMRSEIHSFCGHLAESLIETVDYALAMIGDNTVHQIKLQSPYIDAVYSGKKTFEIRKNDRGYKVGDMIEFIPYDKVLDKPFRHPIIEKRYRIEYIIYEGWGLEKGTCVFSIKEVDV